ncbi:MAG: ABC transporter permease, partial [Candidatus Hydrogenedentales bacterium]
MSITIKPSSLLPSFITAVGIARLKRTVQLGMKSLWMHRLRSLLTGLGIVFGVCSVIAMLAIGEGLSYEAQEQIRRLGSNNIIIRSVKPPDDRSTSAQRTWMIDYGLTYDDVSRIRNTIPGVEIIVPSRLIRKDIWNLANRIDCDIVGTVSWYPEMRNHHTAKGRFFSEDEVATNENVCVLGDGMAEVLYPLDDPIGRSVRVDGDYYRVIGIMEPLSKQANGNGANASESGAKPSAQAGAGAPYQMYIPLTAAKTRFGETLVQRGSGSFSAERVELHEATIKVENMEDVIETWHIIADLLSANHKKSDYDIVVPLDLLRQAERTKRIFNIVLGAIAG